MKWISVDERLPDEYEEVLVHFADTSFTFVGKMLTTASGVKVFESIVYDYCSYRVDSRAYWQPLPPPPEES